MAKRRPGPGEFSKYGSIRILQDGRIRFSALVFPGLLDLDFVVLHDRDPAREGISVRWRGQPIFLIFVEKRRVASTCFGYQLTPDELRNAVDIIRRAGNGLERWIVPGLEWTLENLGQMRSNANRAAVKALIPELIHSARDLPIAKQWKRRGPGAAEPSQRSAKRALPERMSATAPR